MKNKQLIKIALLSAPIVGLVIASMAGLGEAEAKGIEAVVVDIIILFAGALGVTGVIVNNDKKDKE